MAKKPAPAAQQAVEPRLEIHRPIIGRPPKLAWDQRTADMLTALGRMFATMDEVASVLGVSRTTLWAFLKKFPEAQEIFDIAVDQAKVGLRRAQMIAANKGNPAMLIWLGKQHLGQTDELKLAGEIRTGSTGARDRLKDELNRTLGATAAASVVGGEGGDLKHTH